MGNNRQKSHFERARDELYSHVIRCDVLHAGMDDRRAWMDDTIEYMAGRYPDLTDLEVAQIEMIGRRFIEPAIPHGSSTNASNRDEWQDDSADEPEVDLVGAR